MHYCFFTTGSWEGNASLIRPAQLGAQMIERGVEVTYLVDDVPYNGSNLNLHSKARLAFVPNPRSLGQIPARRRVLRQLKPDFVDLINPHIKSFLALVASSQRIVGEWDEPPTMKDLGFFKNRMFGFLDRWLRKRAEVRIACTLFVQEWFREKYNLPTAHIPHAPYLNDYPDGESPFTEPTAVYMGNLFPLWDHDITLEAARILKRRGKSPKVLLMGGGPDLEKWQRFVAEEKLHNVTLAGFVSGEELWRRLRHAHVLLFPIRPTMTNKLRCPSKVFAYAQSRRPIITSRTGELPFMLGERPESPIYIESTPESFADAIERVMREPRRPDVDYNLERHSWAARADRLIEVLNRYQRGEDPYV